MTKKGKIITIVTVVLVGALGIVLPLTLLKPNDTSKKSVVIEIVCERLSIRKSFTFSTKVSSMQELLQEQSSKLNPDIITSAYGDYVNTIYNIVLQGNEYVAVYTSDDEYADKLSPFNPPYTSKGGKTCWATTVGITLLPLKTNTTYVFIVLTY